MQFKSDGPDIPGHLLEARDRGNVVFLCGAGVSMPAGMPSFERLARAVYERLDPEPGTDTHRAFASWSMKSLPDSAKTPLDQVFEAMHLEFGKHVVDREVARCLNSVPCRGPSDKHNIVARISTDRNGNQRIVTTNFDTYFETTGVKRANCYHTPPHLPRLGSGRTFSGTVYLHGRLRSNNDDDHDYVLSSGDFGSAYLVAKWANSFVQDLVKNYTVVILGYSVQDPPIRMLLQGLRTQDRHNIEQVCAFERGSQRSVASRWLNLGVTGIGYNDASKDHERLWQSLAAWANRSDDPAKWRSTIVSKAARGPGSCEPYERGQVMHVLGTLEGAKAFARARRRSPPTWLCVFDREIRLGPDKYGFHTAAQFGLNAEYSQDSTVTEICIPQEIFSASTSGSPENEKIDTEIERELHRWLISHATEPVVAWWCIKRIQTHRSLIEKVHEHLQRVKGISKNALWVWSAIRSQYTGAVFRHNLPRGDFDGWRVGNKLSAEDLTWIEGRDFPWVIVTEAEWLGSVRPPTEDWTYIDKAAIGVFRFQEPNLPSFVDTMAAGSKAELLRSLLRGLSIGSRHLTEVSRRNFRDHSAPLFQQLAFDFGVDPLEKRVTFINKVIISLCNDGDREKVSELLREADYGRRKEVTQVVLNALNIEGLFGSIEVAEILEKVFDSPYYAEFDWRQFVDPVIRWWRELPKDFRRAILIDYQKMLQVRDDNALREGSSGQNASLNFIRVLDARGCELPEDVFTSSDISANTENGAATIESALPKGGEGTKEPVPGSVPGCSADLFKQMALREGANLLQMPPIDYARLILYSGYRLRGLVEAIARHDAVLAVAVVTSWIEHLAGGPSIYGGWAGGKDELEWDETGARKDSDEDFYQSNEFFAVLQATEALFDLLRTLTKAGMISYFPQAKFEASVNRLMSIGGQCSEVVREEIGRSIWLIQRTFPNWVHDFVFPRLGVDVPGFKSFWTGIFVEGNDPPPARCDLIRSKLMDFLSVAHEIDVDGKVIKEGQKWLVRELCLSMRSGRNDVEVDRKMKEMRAVIRRIPDASRVTLLDVLAELVKIGELGWKDGARFFESVWPLDRSVNTESVSIGLVTVLEATGSEFREVWPSVRSLLVPIQGHRLCIVGFAGRVNSENVCIAEDFPGTLLSLLNRVISSPSAVDLRELRAVLEKIHESEPCLEEDNRFLRLKRFVDGGQ